MASPSASCSKSRSSAAAASGSIADCRRPWLRVVKLCLPGSGPVGAGGNARALRSGIEALPRVAAAADAHRSEEHTSELQSLMRISYAVFCLNKTIDRNVFLASIVCIILLLHHSTYHIQHPP